MLNLHLFGSLGVSWQAVGGTTEPIPLTARPGSLLAFLALSRGHFFTRGELITTLWGERHESSTVGCFNTTLWRLRKAVERPPLPGASLIACSHHGAIGMPEEAALVLDVDRFQHFVVPALTKPIEKVEPADVSDLKSGVACYTDDILAGFADEWAMREREKLRRHHLNALGRLMQLSTLAHDYAGAIAYAQQILDRDVLREDIHCGLMRLFLLNGQRALALRQFERCRDALRRELAIQPMRETITLYQQIAEHALGHGDTLDEAMAPSDAPVYISPPSPAKQPTFLSLPLPTATADLISAAREHLALADQHLLRTLPLMASGSNGAGR